MCGRFYNHLPAMHTWVEILKDWPGAATSSNVGPTTAVPIIIDGELVIARWGLVPAWSKEFSSKYATHNARIETVAEKPTFRSAWKEKRSCLVPINGYYEWKQEKGQKQPFVVTNSDSLMLLAGLWESWEGKTSFTILTEQAEGKLSQLHPRKPFLLTNEGAIRWVSKGELSVDGHEDVSRLDIYRCSREVNNSRNQDPHIHEKVP